MRNADARYKNFVSGSLKGTFTYFVERILAEGLEVITTEEAALLRINTKPSESRMNSEYHGYVEDIHSGFYTREGCIWVPNEQRMYLTKNSPFMDKCNLVGESAEDKDFFYLDNVVARALKDACPIKNSQIPIGKLLRCAEYKYLFGSQAESYARFLESLGVKKFSFGKFYFGRDMSGASKKDRPIAGQCWLAGIYQYNMPDQHLVEREEQGVFMDFEAKKWDPDGETRWISDNPAHTYTGEFDVSYEDIRQAVDKLGKSGLSGLIKNKEHFGKLNHIEEGGIYMNMGEFFDHPFRHNSFGAELAKLAEKERTVRVETALRKRKGNPNKE